MLARDTPSTCANRVFASTIACDEAGIDVFVSPIAGAAAPEMDTALGAMGMGPVFSGRVKSIRVAKRL